MTDYNHQPEPGQNPKKSWFTTEIKDNLLRGIYMVLFFIVLYVLWMILVFIAIVQFIIRLIWNRCNQNLLNLAENLIHYYKDILNYVTYNSEKIPYPFSPWPTSKQD